MIIAQTTVKLSDLSIDPANVRKTGRGEQPKFAASIQKRGVIEPLIVRATPNGYVIVNGGERFTALEHLMKKGLAADGELVTKDYPVKVTVIETDDAGARATSLATNLVRSDMHPVDEFEAFAKMVQDGATLESIGAEYARPVPEIRQALSLAAIAPEVRAAWRAGEIDGDAAEAFAQTKDLAHQVRILKKLKKRAGEAWAVTEEIAGARTHEIGRLLKFVTPKAYEAAGHHINPSLFADEDDRDPTVISNIPALKALASRKLDETLLKLKKDGWGWAVLREDAPKDLYAWRRLTGKLSKAQMKNAGCVVEVNYLGNAEIERGYVKPSDNIKVEKTKAERAASKKAGPAKPSVISAALATRLSETLTRAADKVVGENATPRMVLQIAVTALGVDGAFDGHCVRIEGGGLSSDDLHAGRDFDKELAIVAKLTDQDLAKRFANLVGASLNMTNANPARLLTGNKPQDPDVSALVHFLPAEPLQDALDQLFDAKDYFENAPGAMALAALNDMGLKPLTAMKKAALAAMAATEAKAQGWLPPQLRTAGYEGPKAKATPKKTTKRKTKL